MIGLLAHKTTISILYENTKLLTQAVQRTLYWGGGEGTED